MQLTISSASTGLYSTWVFIEEVGLLFDAGDGVSAALCQKTGRIKHIFLSHADRDHICGLLQLHQLNARDGHPAIYYPKDCGSFPAMKDFMARFDPQSGPATWSAIASNERYEIKDSYFVHTHPSDHIRKGEDVKALCFTLKRTRKKLRPAYQGLSWKEIAKTKQEIGEDALTEMIDESLIGYSGDVPALEPERWAGVKTLFHEATFLESDTGRGQHANLPQVIAASANLSLEALVLFHFSSRYKPQEIKQAIRQQAAIHKIAFPIYSIMPQRVYLDVLSELPVWEP